MRILPLIVLGIGILMLAGNGYDELIQITSVPPYHHNGSRMVLKQDNPKQFRDAMTYHWSTAGIITVVGAIWLTVNQWMERSSQMGTGFRRKK